MGETEGRGFDKSHREVYNALRKDAIVNISLTPELDRWVHNKVSRGQYSTASELIREGLRLMQQREEIRQAMRADLRRELQVGLQQLDAGESRIFDGNVLRVIKEKGRERKRGWKNGG